ncbi:MULTISPECIES: sulfite exporter TauE/SafE family protein [Paenibacillus]|uniref:sulfite exporter TauE/SafE family protein n=1 Tax=Paenibacillus TaxID=44249 RepID=UPI0022B937A8|nr:sulfite exporter TauE/SafE family protein [Paenibacillus caseinilyticus]MCZ8519965.1 sulfite exporter TauE/SafE family protein [Paenibacillus caseinilyticus]
MTMPWSDAVLALLGGLFGAPHCIGMCGGTAAGYALEARSGPLRAVLFYNAGRVLTYTMLGAFMGAVGSFIDGAGRIAELQGAATFVGGCLILLWALRGTRLRIPVPAALRRLRASAERRGLRWKGKGTPAAALLGGLLLGFLPCGLTYAMQMNAAAGGSPYRGALLLAAFGLGTVPALLLAGLTARRLGRALRSRARAAGTAVAVTMGVLCILRGLAAGGWIPSVHPWLW